MSRLLSTRLLHRRNPYVQLATEDTGSAESVLPERTLPLEDGSLLLFENEMDVENAMRLEEKKGTVQLLCILEGCTSLYYIMYGVLYGVALALVSYLGFLSTVYYSRWMLVGTLALQMAKVGGRVATLVVFLWNPNHVRETWFVYHDVASFVTISSCLLVFQVYLAHLVWSFFVLLPRRHTRVVRIPTAVPV